MAVFFTHGVSLELWDQRGMFSREVRFYQALAEKVGEIGFFTYGADDARYANRVGPNIKIFPKRFAVPDWLWGLLLPFAYARELRDVSRVRIHQLAGAIPALIARWVFRKHLIVRGGFQWYLFAKRQNASRLKLLLISLIERLAYRAADAIIHTTKNDADFVAKRYGIDPKKILVVPNYVDTELFKPIIFPVILRPAKPDEGSQISRDPSVVSLPQDDRKICFVGRLEPQKNLCVLIDAMQGVNATLVLYGEGSQREELETRAHSLGVRADFRGRIANEDLPTALNACDIFVIPSLYEGNPKVLLEAMACGLPVVGTNVEGIASLIEDEKTGLLCEPTPDSIRQAIKRLLNDSDLQSKLGSAAREHIVATSSLERAIQAEAPLYFT